MMSLQSPHPSPIDWATWTPEIHATLMFVIRDEQVLLIQKKRGIGAGKVNGPGGKIEANETPRQCAIRETQEELGILVEDPQKIGELHFVMSDIPDIRCHVYRAEDFTGTPGETAEANPFWCALTAIPFHDMWQDDRYWFPYLINRRHFLGRFCMQQEEIHWYQLQLDLRWDKNI